MIESIGPIIYSNHEQKIFVATKDPIWLCHNFAQIYCQMHQIKDSEVSKFWQSVVDPIAAYLLTLPNSLPVVLFSQRQQRLLFDYLALRKNIDKYGVKKSGRMVLKVSEVEFMNYIATKGLIPSQAEFFGIYREGETLVTYHK